MSALPSTFPCRPGPLLVPAIAPRPTLPPQWTSMLFLAWPGCSYCYGLGCMPGRHAPHPCNCVLREIFRACFEHYRDCQGRAKYVSKVTFDPLPGKDRRGCWARKSEEFSADFCLTAKRTLMDSEYELFKLHFLSGRDWKVCSRKLRMDRGNFFHVVYRIEQKLGRVFRELEPYSLYPIDEYMHGPVKGVRSCLAEPEVRRRA